jgi:hypothetical protein
LNLDFRSLFTLPLCLGWQAHTTMPSFYCLAGRSHEFFALADLQTKPSWSLPPGIPGTSHRVWVLFFLVMSFVNNWKGRVRQSCEWGKVIRS